MPLSMFLRSHLDTSAELRFSLGSLAETQSDHYRSAKVIRRPRRGRLGLREPKVTSDNNSFFQVLLCGIEQHSGGRGVGGGCKLPSSQTGSNRKPSYC